MNVLASESKTPLRNAKNKFPYTTELRKLPPELIVLFSFISIFLARSSVGNEVVAITISQLRQLHFRKLSHIVHFKYLQKKTFPRFFDDMQTKTANRHFQCRKRLIRFAEYGPVSELHEHSLKISSTPHNSKLLLFAWIPLFKHFDRSKMIWLRIKQCTKPLELDCVFIPQNKQKQEHNKIIFQEMDSSH